MAETTLSLEKKPVFGLILSMIAVPIIGTVISIYIDGRDPDQLSCDQVAEQLERQDFAAEVPKHAMLVLGGKNLRRWHFPPDDLAGSAVVVRMVRGLTTSKIAECFQRSVAFYQPTATVLFPDADSTISGSLALTQAVADLETQKDYFAVSPLIAFAMPLNTPANPDRHTELAALKSVVESPERRLQGIVLLDLNAAVHDESGKVDPLLFWPDGETLNEKGLRRLFIALDRQLTEALAQQ